MSENKVRTLQTCGGRNGEFYFMVILREISEKILLGNFWGVIDPPIPQRPSRCRKLDQTPFYPSRG